MFTYIPCTLAIFLVKFIIVMKDQIGPLSNIIDFSEFSTKEAVTPLKKK